MIAALACTAVLVVLVGTSAVVERRRYRRELLRAILRDMTVQFRAISQVIGESLVPVLREMASAVSEFGEALTDAMRRESR